MKHEGSSMGGTGGRGGGRPGGSPTPRRLFLFGLSVHEEWKEMKLQPNHPIDKTTSNLYARSASEVFVCLALWKLHN